MESDREMFVSCRGSGPGTQEGVFFLATRKAQFIKDLMDNSILFFFHFGYNFCSLGHFWYETQQCIYNHI